MAYDIAITGIANRFPGAPDRASFWSLLDTGTTTFEALDSETLRGAGTPDELLESAAHVPFASRLDNIEDFDREFFGMTAREAVVLDPQHRLFLECAWEALEDAGIDPGRTSRSIGVFAGASLNAYLIRNLACDPMLLTTPSGFLSLVANEKDYLASRAAYGLDLHGPAITVQTACSTSMAAVHVAMQSLVLGECDVALAGGVSIRVPQETGFLHHEGMPFSADGTCRPFDARGTGTVFGSGAGVVVLKPLEAARDDRDEIYATILASAVNNDGSRKVGFTAPSVDGQADVIRRAILLADVEPSEIGYVEAHGTATTLGDPIEVAALAQVFGNGRSTPCRIGSVKSNIGHMETAAGVAGLIKTALMLKHRRFVPSSGFETPNPHIDFNAVGMTVQTESEAWIVPEGMRRRAGVSSFGMGGTNVHMVLEEPPEFDAGRATAPRRNLFVLSARSDAALAQAGRNLADWCAGREDSDAAEVAANLQLRRAHMQMRQAFTAATLADAAAKWARSDLERNHFGPRFDEFVGGAFVYCGAGAQFPGMMADLTAVEPVFRTSVERSAALFESLMGLDILPYLTARVRGDGAAEARMRAPDVMFPALFAVQNAMGDLLESWGLRPSLVMGHSNGEYAAAVRAGVMALETAITLVATRARLMMELPAGGMISVAAGVDAVLPVAKRFDLSIGADNAPANVVLSGTRDRLDAAELAFRGELGLRTRPILVSAALHSHLMHGISDRFAEIASGMEFNAPNLPWISTVSGEFMDPSRAPSDQYWVDHLTERVQFRKAAETLVSLERIPVVTDLGPGHVAGDLLRQNTRASAPVVVSAARAPHERTEDDVAAIDALARLWTLGADVDWLAFNDGIRPVKCDMPHYPWQRRRYWIDPPVGGPSGSHVADHFDEQRGAVSLPETDDRPVLTSMHVAPQTDTEHRLLALWQSFLGIARIGTADDFIELGGTSLMATELVAAINAEFGTTLDLRRFLQCRNAAGVSRALDELVRDRDARLLAEALAEIEGMSDEQLAALSKTA